MKIKKKEKARKTLEKERKKKAGCELSESEKISYAFFNYEQRLEGSEFSGLTVRPRLYYGY